jgi:hypothetical protein
MINCQPQHNIFKPLFFVSGYQPINIFRYDSKLKTIYIQGGVNDEIALVIYSDGNWRFF